MTNHCRLRSKRQYRQEMLRSHGNVCLKEQEPPCSSPLAGLFWEHPCLGVARVRPASAGILARTVATQRFRSAFREHHRSFPTGPTDSIFHLEERLHLHS